jgi:hypothetical protein
MRYRIEIAGDYLTATQPIGGGPTGTSLHVFDC